MIDMPVDLHERTLAIKTMASLSGVHAILERFMNMDQYNGPGLNISVLTDSNNLESMVLNVSDVANESRVSYFSDAQSDFFIETGYNNINWQSTDKIRTNIPALGVVFTNLDSSNESLITFLKVAPEVIIIPKIGETNLEGFVQILAEEGIELKVIKLSEKFSSGQLQALARQGINSEFVFTKN